MKVGPNESIYSAKERTKMVIWDWDKLPRLASGQWLLENPKSFNINKTGLKAINSKTHSIEVQKEEKQVSFCF